MNRCALPLICALIVGCQHPAGTASSQTHRQVAIQATPRPHGSNAMQLDADQPYLTRTHNPNDVVVVLDVYTITAPLGSISGNDEFWKKIDEDHVDVTNHDLLLKNGIRYGLGPADDEGWSGFRAILDKQGATSQKRSLGPLRAAVSPLPMRTGIDYQDLFYLNEAGQLYGRTYQHCDNLFSIGFEAIPDLSGDTRVHVSAVVHDLRYQFVVTAENRADEFERRQMDYLYDLNLEAKVPFKQFLIIAPSELAKLPYNLGGNFLIHPGVAGQVETILILAPKPYQLGIQFKQPPAPTKAGK